MDFEKDDVLAMHTHAHADVHITIVTRGEFAVHGPSIPITIHQPGAVIDFQEGHPHEIIATKAGRIVNIQKHVLGKPTASPAGPA